MTQGSAYTKHSINVNCCIYNCARPYSHPDRCSLVRPPVWPIPGRAAKPKAGALITPWPYQPLPNPLHTSGTYGEGGDNPRALSSR